MPNPNKNAASDKARAEYKIAKAKCDNLPSSAIGACVTDAQATRDRALNSASKQSTGQPASKTTN
jgi:hypothetical protein